MLTSNRFTVIPTKKCRARLEAVLSNETQISRGERNRAVVVAIQSAISDLNKGYMLPAEIDGYFGSRTSEAVESFQRDYGLAADSIVGRQTMGQLDALFSGDTLRKPKGLSVHVGVDKVSEQHYGPGAQKLELQSCVNDARKMCEIAESLGYDAVTYENSNATISNFTGFMRNAISDLCAGDSLLFTFSGHGSQIPNTSADAEADNLDETMLFYDRMLIDDELYQLLSQIKEGVKVHLVFDSCHSGSAAKSVDAISLEQDDHANKIKGQLIDGNVPVVEGPKAPIPDPEKEEQEELSEEDLLPIKGEGLADALDGNTPVFADAPKPKNQKNRKNADDGLVTLFKDLYSEDIPGTGNKKQANFWDLIHDDNKDVYAAVKNVVGDNEDTQLFCSVISLSACQDSQTTPAGIVYSYFTYNIMNIWNSGDFKESYNKFHKRLVNTGRADATPVISTYGTNISNARLYDRPFVF